MENALRIPARRALRMATATALCVAISFALDLSIPVVAPVFAAFLATQNRPLSLREGAALTLVVLLTTGSGLLLVPLLRHYAAAGVMIVGLLLFLAFRYGLRSGNNLVATFLAAGLTMISAAGTANFALAVTVVSALVNGLVLAVLVSALTHLLFPERVDAAKRPGKRTMPEREAMRVAWRAAFVVMPAYLLATTDPASYMPIIMKAVSLGRQSCTTTARSAARDLIGSTLLGGALAISFWFALKLFVHVWMFFLWMLLFGLVVGRKIYGLSRTRYPAGFWLNSLVTMIILLGQSVQDSVAGKDVYTAFAIRMGLFLSVTAYACLMLLIFERRSRTG